MDREKAIQMLKRCEAESHCNHYKQHYCCIGCGQREALDLAIEALEREIEYGQMVVDFTKGETMKSDEWKYDTTCDAESATTTDCNYTCSDCKYQDRTYEQEPCHSCFNNDGAGYEPDTDCISRADTIKAMCQECKVFLGDGVNCADCTEVAIIKGMPPVKLKNPDDSLLKSDSDERKEQKSKLDCISRQQAIEALMGHFIPQTYTGEQVEQAEKLAQKILNEVPPVTPTERTGEWISLFDGNEWSVHCSKCKTQHYEEDLLMGGSELPNFCPNCGAKMKGGKE